MTNRLAQLLELIESLCQLTVTAPPQLSLVVTLLVSGAGTRLAQLTVRLVVQVMLGGLVSWMAIVWVRLEVLTHRFDSRWLRVLTHLLAQLLELIESPC